MKPLCIYHGNCLDGFTAAWAMWLKHPDTEFVPGVYGQEPPNCTGRNVYLLDFSYKRPVMEKIALEAQRVIVLDHHKTAEADLAGLGSMMEDDNTTVVFDMQKSGARLAWEWFHPTAAVPLLVRLVEDRDLWRFALPDSKAMNAAFFSYDYDFYTWSQFDAMLRHADHRQNLLLEGDAILRKQEKDIRELIAKLKHTRHFYRVMIPADKRVEDYDVPCANLPYTLASDAANLMAEGVPFAATYYQDAKGYFVFSLRSKEDGADVSEIAARYGGGGHQHAAGFRIQSLEEL